MSSFQDFSEKWRNKKTFSENLDLTLDRDNFPNIFHIETSEKDKRQIDEFIHNDIHFTGGSWKPLNGPIIVLHTGHSFKFPYGKSPNYEWWIELVNALPDANFIQVTSGYTGDFNVNQVIVSPTPYVVPTKEYNAAYVVLLTAVPSHIIHVPPFVVAVGAVDLVYI